MTASRRDIFDTYTAQDFERAFAPHFAIDQRVMLSPSDRTLYLMTAR